MIGSFSKIPLWACHTIFLGQNLMGNPKKHISLQNFQDLPRSGNALYISHIITPNIPILGCFVINQSKVVRYIVKYVSITVILASKPIMLIRKPILS